LTEQAAAIVAIITYR